MLSLLGMNHKEGHEYQAPKPTGKFPFNYCIIPFFSTSVIKDARSPCPFLNAMANHVSTFNTFAKQTLIDYFLLGLYVRSPFSLRRQPEFTICSPRDGRYITLWAATKGLMECYSYSLGLALFVASAGIYTSLFTNLNPFWFDLEQLRVHNKISVEHDASLS